MKKLQRILEWVIAFLMFLAGGMSKSEGGGMRKIDLIVIHCSATREDRCFTEFDLDVCHRRRGFNGPGYHSISARTGGLCPLVR